MPDIQSSHNQTHVLDRLFQATTVLGKYRPRRPRPKKNFSVNYSSDYAESVPSELFFKHYMSKLHGDDSVSAVHKDEQFYGHRGDVFVKHQDGDVEFEVKFENKGLSTGRHAIEFTEYNTDYMGDVIAERCPGWFRLCKAHIVVPVVPTDEENIIMYPYDLSLLRRYLAKIAFQAHNDGNSMRSADGTINHKAMLEVLADLIDGAVCTYGPVNELGSGYYKRSMSLCIPYQYLLNANLTKPYLVTFDS